MSTQSSPAGCPVSPAQVWARLATDLQERAIRLMAQLAFNLVFAPSDGNGKEPNRDGTSQQAQDPV
jgi:hypothetical protein